MMVGLRVIGLLLQLAVLETFCRPVVSMLTTKIAQFSGVISLSSVLFDFDVDSCLIDTITRLLVRLATLFDCRCSQVSGAIVSLNL